MTKVGVRTFQSVDGDYEIIQVRVGGGRGFGFVRQEGQGITLDNLSRVEPEIYRNLLEQTRLLLSRLEEAGGESSDR